MADGVILEDIKTGWLYQCMLLPDRSSRVICVDSWTAGRNISE